MGIALFFAAASNLHGELKVDLSRANHQDVCPLTPGLHRQPYRHRRFPGIRNVCVWQGNSLRIGGSPRLH
jgi:hypothetical protein